MSINTHSTKRRKTPGSPRLHNFNICIPEHGSLGTRLRLSEY